MNHTENRKLLGAIDIGTTKIVSVIGQKNEEGRFEILGMGTCPSYGVKRGLVNNVEETVSSIRAAIDKMAEGTELSVENVVVGIAGQHVKSIKNTMKITIRAEDRIIREQDVLHMKKRMFETQVGAGEAILHVIPQYYRIDGKDSVDQPVGLIASELEGTFHLVIGKLNSMENLKNCVQRVDKKVEKLILEPLASADAVLSQHEKEIGVTLVDIGGGTTDISVYKDKILQHTAVIPLGGNVVTSDIKQAFNVLGSQAEELKIQEGYAIQSKTQENIVIQIPGIKGRETKNISLNDLVYVIQERMKEIIYAIKFQIEASGYADKIGAGIVITGGGALLRNLSQLFKQITGYNVIIGYPRDYIFGPFADEVNQPMFSTAVGLIIQYDKVLELQAHEKDIPDELFGEDEEIGDEEKLDVEENEENIKSKPKGNGFFARVKKGLERLGEDDDNFSNE